jgi:pyridoxal phosphate enzyme (YggS family)
MTTREEFLARSLESVQSRISVAATSAGRTAEEITLIAVTKTYPTSDAEILRTLGVSNFGENRDAEGAEKSAAVQGIWHFQGQIQSKKLKSIASWASVIHSIDNLEHLQKLSKVLENSERKVDVFLQLSLDGDAARGGVVASSIAPLADYVMSDPALRLMGLMCVPPVEADIEQSFAAIESSYQSFLHDYPDADKLSAGMSNDFEIAIKHGATHIRVGSEILGSRTYPQ